MFSSSRDKCFDVQELAKFLINESYFFDDPKISNKTYISSLNNLKFNK